MKKISILFFIVLVSLIGCDKNDAVILDENTSESQVRQSQLKSASTWHALSQAQRDQAILNRAMQNNGQHVGLDCKNWAKSVVWDASTNVVWLPSTNANNYTWASDPNIGVIPSVIEVASPGNIVQMALSSGGPHTAIIYARTYTNVTFIESNWCLPATCNTVNLRTITFAQFHSQVSNFSIYYVK
jgi:hypothetical protein